MAQMGEFCRIQWITKAKGRKGAITGYWCIRPINLDGEPGWRLTYELRDRGYGSGKAPQQGHDPKEGVQYLIDLLHQNVIDCHGDYMSECSRLDAVPSRPGYWPPGQRRPKGVKDYFRWKAEQERRRAVAAIKTMEQNVFEVCITLAVKGWPPGIIPDYPWGTDNQGYFDPEAAGYKRV